MRSGGSAGQQGGGVATPHKETDEVIIRRTNTAATPLPDDEYETFAQDLLSQSRGLVLGAIDIAAWIIGLSFMAMLLASFENSFVDISNLVLTVAAAALMQVAGGLLSKLYLGRWVIASVQELTDLAASWLGAAVAATAVGLSVEPEVMSASAFVGGNLVVSATGDGVIEAVESPGDDFVLAVQWHPEETLDDLRLFAGVVEAARARATDVDGAHQRATQRATDRVNP